MKKVLPVLALLFLLTGCGQLDTILYTPLTTPETWLQIQPYAEIQFGAQTIIFMQPSTSIIVYLLGLLTIGIGVHFLRTRGGERSRLWWGVSLILWGVGALLAGTSYEALSYDIKCAGREACLWTSWWEIAYLLVTVWSLDAMVAAVAYSSTLGRLRKGLMIYAAVNAALYTVLLTVGVFVPVKFLISFEFLLVMGAPGFLIMFVINLRRYLKEKLKPELYLVGAWLWMALTVAAYFLYYVSGFTAVLWENGVWFSENDVLHIFLIIWMLYIAKFVAPTTRDMQS